MNTKCTEDPWSEDDDVQLNQALRTKTNGCQFLKRTLYPERHVWEAPQRQLQALTTPDSGVVGSLGSFVGFGVPVFRDAVLIHL